MKTIILIGLIAGAAQLAHGQMTPEELGVVMAPDIKQQAEAPKSHARPSAAATASVDDQNRACPGEDAVFLPTGFSFPAMLPDAIYSYNTLAPVTALIEDDIKFRGKVVLPRGTRLVGTASTLHTLDRVNLTWALAVFPEGCEFNISAIALSADDGSAGIKGKLEKHEDSIAAHVAMKSVLSAASAAAAIASPIEGAVASGVSNEAGQNIDESLAKVKSLDSIFIHERTAIRVLILRRFLVTGEGK